MGAKKGHRPPNAGIGRVKGVPNKLTQSVKDCMALAFDRLGGVDGLVDWAERDDKNRSTFYQSWSRLAPREVLATVDVTLLTPEERRARIAQLLGK